MKPRTLSRCVAVFAAAAFLWTIALSVAPELHQRIHADQRGADHSCAVTFVGSGSYLHSATPPLTARSGFTMEFGAPPELVSCWVPSPFLSGAVFEHAPPFLS
jgi:hypothetical protein